MFKKLTFITIEKIQASINKKRLLDKLYIKSLSRGLVNRKSMFLDNHSFLSLTLLNFYKPSRKSQQILFPRKQDEASTGYSFSSMYKWFKHNKDASVNFFLNIIPQKRSHQKYSFRLRNRFFSLKVVKCLRFNRRYPSYRLLHRSIKNFLSMPKPLTLESQGAPLPISPRLKSKKLKR